MPIVKSTMPRAAVPGTCLLHSRTTMTGKKRCVIDIGVPYPDTFVDIKRRVCYKPACIDAFKIKGLLVCFTVIEKRLMYEANEDKQPKAAANKSENERPSNKWKDFLSLLGPKTSHVSCCAASSNL